MDFAMMRPAMSAPEPAVSGTIMRIGRAGESCAKAKLDAEANSRAAAIPMNVFMASPL
jgi:hypothetical protein